LAVLWFQDSEAIDHLQSYLALPSLYQACRAYSRIWTPYLTWIACWYQTRVWLVPWSWSCDGEACFWMCLRHAYGTPTACRRLAVGPHLSPPARRWHNLLL